MNRRDFLLLSSAGALDLALCSCSKLSPLNAQELGADDKYSIVILGDTHFATEPASEYHSKYNEKIEW